MGRHAHADVRAERHAPAALQRVAEQGDHVRAEPAVLRRAPRHREDLPERVELAVEELVLEFALLLERDVFTEGVLELLRGPAHGEASIHRGPPRALYSLLAPVTRISFRLARTAA